MVTKGPDGHPSLIHEPTEVAAALVARFKEWMGGTRRDGTEPEE